MRLEVPYLKQDKNHTCGPAVLNMVFGYFGLVKSEVDIIRELPISSETGTTHDSMMALAKRHGFFCYARTGASTEEVVGFLDKTLPVIVNFIEPSNDEGHYAVVVGYDKGALILNDPWNGEGFVMKKEEFEKRWRGESEPEARWLMVLSREKIEVGL